MKRGGTKLSLLLDNERWKQADVPAEFQDLVDSIADGKIALPEKSQWLQKKGSQLMFLLLRDTSMQLSEPSCC